MVPPPAISVLTAVRNGLPHLAAAIASIREQSLPDWEWILVDDGSTDSTGALLADQAREDPRLRVLTVRAEGLVPALNRGLEAARAPIVARMDADDVAHPERLENVISKISFQILSAHSLHQHPKPVQVDAVLPPLTRIE